MLYQSGGSDTITEEEVNTWVSHLIAINRLDQFYSSPAWRKLRKEVLEEHIKDGCVDCKAKGIYTEANIVHHQQYVRKHPRYALSKTYTFKGVTYINLVPLCHEHHEERHGYRKIVIKEPLTVERW